VGDMATPVKYNLVFYVSGKQWRVTPVSLKKPICFGMSEKCNVRLSSTGTLDLLDEHAWLLLEDNKIYLKVAGKTKLNGEEVPEGKVAYNIGDKIQFGEKDKLILVLEHPPLGPEGTPVEPTKKEKKPKEKKPADKTKSPKETKKTNVTEKAEPMLIEGAKTENAVVGEVEPKTSEVDAGTEQPPVASPTEVAPTVEESPKPSPKKQKGPKTPKAKVEVSPKSSRKPTPPKETKTKTPPKPAAAKVTPPKLAKVASSPKTPKQSKAPVSPPKSGAKSKESSQSLFPTGNAAKAASTVNSPVQEEKRVSRSSTGTPAKEAHITPSRNGKTPQTDEVVEICENGNTFKIPPLRTREEVDEMSLDDILLEMVSLSRGHDVKVSQNYIKRWYSKKQFTIAEITEALQKLAREAKILTKDFDEGKKTVTCYYDINMPVTDDEAKEGDVAETKEIAQSPNSSNQREVRASSKRKLDDQAGSQADGPVKKRGRAAKKTEPETESKESETPKKETTKTTEAKEETGMEVEKESEAVSENKTPQQQEEVKQFEAKEEVGSAMEVISETNPDNLEGPTITNL